jgi:hypothetical protein
MKNDDEAAIMAFLELPPGLAETAKLAEPYEEYLGQKVVNSLLGSHKWEDGYRISKNGMEIWGKDADTGSNARKISHETNGSYKIGMRTGDLRFDLTVSGDGNRLDLTIGGSRESYLRFKPEAEKEITQKRYREEKTVSVQVTEFVKGLSEEGNMVEEQVSCRRIGEEMLVSQSWGYNMGLGGVKQWLITVTATDGLVDIV